MSYDVVKESVPNFIKRVGDRVIEGSNNVTVVFGTDRAAAGDAGLDSGLGHVNAAGGGKGAGSWHVMVGRTGENPNFKTDSAFVYLSMKTSVDKNMETTQEFDAGDVSAAIIKADSVRLVARNDIKIVVGKSYVTLKSDGTVYVVGKKLTIDGEVHLGRNAQEKLIRGDAFKTLFNSHGHPTAVGPSGPPIQQMSDLQVSPKKFTD